MTTLRCLSGLKDIADNYDAFLFDLWGVVHNGVKPFPGALDTLAALTEMGKPAILLSNAPRLGVDVDGRLAQMGVPREHYQRVVASGDLARKALAEQPETFGSTYAFWGKNPDRSVIADLPYTETEDLATADFLLGCGYNDDQTETLADYQDRLQSMLDNDVLMVCVNPDYEVLSGDRRLPCAGSLTLRYDEMGGRSIWYGKPFPVAYTYCMAEFGGIAPDRVLMIGDTIRTDIVGARDSGLDSVLVASGLHGRDFIVDGKLDGDRVSEACAAANVSPVGYMAELAW